MFKNRMLGGASFLPMFAAEDGSGGGAPAGGGAAPAAGAAPAGGAAPAAGAAPGAAAAPAAGADATLAGGGVDPTGAAAAAAAGAAAGTPKPGDLPAGFDFRAYLAGGDKDAEKDLAKYTDPKAVYKSLRDLQAKISKGELKAPPAALPANATPEQKAEYRKANGLPETAEAYVEKLALPDGVVIGAADKPLVADFANAMFEQGASQDEMNRAVSWFYQAQDREKAQRTEADGALRVSSEVALRGEWGADFTPNMNAFGAFKATMPTELQATLFTARTADGRMLGDTPEFLKLGAQLGRMLNPAATLIMPAGADAGKKIGEEIGEIEKSMYDANGNPNRDYWGDETKQARLRELYDMRDRMAAKGKAA
jgi:hypothetical protein